MNGLGIFWRLTSPPLYRAAGERVCEARRVQGRHANRVANVAPGHRGIGLVDQSITLRAREAFTQSSSCDGSIESHASLIESGDAFLQGRARATAAAPAGGGPGMEQAGKPVGPEEVFAPQAAGAAQSGLHQSAAISGRLGRC